MKRATKPRACGWKRERFITQGMANARQHPGTMQAPAASSLPGECKHEQDQYFAANESAWYIQRPFVTLSSTPGDPIAIEMWLAGANRFRLIEEFSRICRNSLVSRVDHS